jgi:hypothetical protein
MIALWILLGFLLGLASAFVCGMIAMNRWDPSLESDRPCQECTYGQARAGAHRLCTCLTFNDGPEKGTHPTAAYCRSSGPCGARGRLFEESK